MRGVFVVLAAVGALLLGAVPASADRAFSQRYAFGGTGDLVTIGNTLMTCPASAANCAGARAGTQTGNALNNNNYAMEYVDVDGALNLFGTDNSSTADLAVPTGATVTFAGLYFGGRSATATDAQKRSVAFRPPGVTLGYTTLTATTLDTANTGDTPDFYQGFVDVTSQVQAAGSGTYAVGNVESDQAFDRAAGWSLVVAYRSAAATRRQLYVFDGLQGVTSAQGRTIPLTGLATPPTGPVDGTIGVVANEGDAGTAGDTLSVGGVSISDAINPTQNVFNSTIGAAGSRLTAKNPNYANQLGWDVDTFTLPTTAIAPGATSASLALGSSGDVYVPGVVTVATRAETDPPQTTLGTAPGGLTNNPRPTFQFSSSEADSTFECSVNGGTAYTDCTSPYTAPTLSDGTYTFAVRATDKVGNVDPTPSTATFTVDTAAPDTAVTSGPTTGSTVPNATPSFTFTSTESGSTFRCSVDNAAYQPCSSGFTTAALADGAHTFRVYAVDAAGNDDSASPAVRTFTVDTTPPDTRITTGPPAGSTTTSRTPSFGFDANGETGASFECAVDAGAFSPCTSAFTTGTLADGSHTFRVRAIDAFGNADATPATRTFTVDATAPETTITGPADGAAVNTATPAIRFTSPDSGATFQCQVDTGAYAACTSPFAPTLADGSHTIRVRAVDAAGNVDATPASITIVVDTAAPDTAIATGPPAGGFATTATPTFTFTSEAGARFECAVDSGAYSSCASPFTTDTLTDGQHTFRVRAVDAAGNTDPTPATRTFTVDTAAPDTTITTPADGAFVNSTTPAIRFTSPDSGATFQCAVDSGTFAPCSAPSTPTLGQGSHTVRVRAVDAAGNVDQTPASVTFTVDTAAPTASITAGPTGTTGTVTPAFAFEADEAGATFFCAVDSTTAFSACTSPFTTPTLGDGSHTFRVYAVDRAGNTSATVSRTFTVDATPPTTTITAPADGTVTRTTRPVVTFTASEAGSTFECSVDDGAFEACASPFTVPTLSEGAHTVRVRATDASGNRGPVASVSLRVDTTAPDTTITDPADGTATRNPRPTVSFTASEAGSSFECAVDDGAFAACTSPFTTPTLTQGPHTVRVRAIDPAGNADASPATVTITVDTTNPVVTISGGPDGPTDDQTPTFTFAADERDAALFCAVDSETTFTRCSSPLTTATLADGPHAFRVYAVDRAGNTSATVTRTFTVDTTAPDTRITAGPDAGATIRTRTPAFGFDADGEAGARFECAVDDGPFVTCASPRTLGSLDDGVHTFRVRAIDTAGNTDASPATRTFTVDATAPETTITAPADGAQLGTTTPTIRFGADEDGSRFECAVDGGAFIACSSPFSPTLGQGAHTVAVRAIDAAGNPDATPATVSFSVDTVAPGTAITSGIDDGTVIGTRTTAFGFDAPNEPASTTFECSVDDGPFTTCTSPRALQDLAEGGHTFAVRAVDAAGNRDDSPATRSFTVDTGAPETTISAPDAGAFLATTTPAIAFSADEAGSTFECAVDAGAFAPCTSPLRTAALGQGEHTVRVRATDRAGNTDPTPASVTFTVDTRAPVATITDGPPARTDDTTPTFEIGADEAGATTFCAVDSTVAFARCDSPFTTAELTEGEHTVRVYAVDRAGNTGPTASRTFTVDTTAPTVTITAPADGTTTNDDTPTIAFTASEAGSSFECSVDDASFAPCTSPFTTDALADGAHAVAIRATDAAGNRGPVARVTLRVDLGAPDTTITVPADGTATADTTPTITASSSEPGSTFECAVDGGAFGSCGPTYTTPTLTQGEHTIRVRATDAAGNTDPTPATVTITVDTTAPAVAFTGGPDEGAEITSTTPTFRFTANEAGAELFCAVDSETVFTPCASPFTTPALADGPHVLRVSAVDRAGNTSATVARSFTVDTGAPDTTITVGPDQDATIRDATPAFAFAADEPRSRFECSVDDGTFVSCASPRELGELADGRHTFRVRAIDVSGNTDPTPAERAFVVDTQAPQTTIGSVTSPTSDTTPAIPFSSSEPGSRFECAVDDGDFEVCDSPFEPELTEGEHTIAVRAVDPAGNADQSPATVTVVVDRTGPQTTIGDTPAAGSRTGDRTPTLTFASEAGATFRCTVDDRDPVDCASPFTTPELGDGEHTVRVVATDAAGNAGPAATRTFTVDTTGPQTTITGPADGTVTNDTTPQVTFTAEAGATFECAVDDGPFADCPSPFTTGALTEGPHTIRVRATDATGNTGPVATVTLRVDVTAPQTTIAAPAAGSVTANATPEIRFSSDTPGATFECAVDGGDFSRCASPLTTAALADGSHTVRVRATDPAGNVEGSPATVTFTVDTAAPDTTGTGPGGTTADPTPTVTFASGDAAATFECRVDGGDWAACTSPFTPEALADGPHVIEVRAVDAAGNRDGSPLEYRFAIDTGAPETTTAGPTGTIETRTATFRLGSDEGGVTFECRLDGGAWAPCTDPYTTPELADGPHTLEVRAVDAQGNRDASPTTTTWTVAVPVTPPTPTPTATPTATATAPAPAPTATPTPAAPAPAPPAVPTGEEDLGAIPGSLVSATRCQKLGGPGFVRTRTPRGIGRLAIRMRSNATDPPGTPLQVTIANASRRLATVSYALDGKRLRSSQSRTRLVKITPRRLATRNRHALRVTFRSRRGQTTSYTLRFRTLRCSAALTVSQSKRAVGNVLRLRVDSLASLSTVTFAAPRTTVQRIQRGRSLKLRFRTLGARTRTVNYTKGAGATLTGPAGAPAVTLTKAGIVVAGLPPKAGIVRLDVRTTAPPIGKGRRATVRANAVAGGKRLPLKTRTRARFSR